MNRNSSDIENMAPSGNLIQPESLTGLAPFEEESAILIDEFIAVDSNMLEEFESSFEIIRIEDTWSDAAQEDEKSPDEPTLDEGNEKEETGKTAQSSDEENLIPGPPAKGEPPTDEEESVTGEPLPALPPLSPVIGFVCGHAIELNSMLDSTGMMKDRGNVHLIKLPCAGMVKSDWITLALDRGASGVFIIACEPGCCHHRTGSCILEARWTGKRRPILPKSVNRDRIRLYQFHRAAKGELFSQIDIFLNHLGKLDSLPPGKSPEKPDSGESIFGKLM